MYKEATGFLKNLPSLAPHPDFEKLHALHKHFITGLTPLVCPQNLIHGWAGIVMDPVMYTLLEPTMPFAAVTVPGDFTVYQNFATNAAIRMTNKIFACNKNYYLSFININRACFHTLNNNIGDQLKVSNLANITGWNSSMSIRMIFEQLEQLYGKPNAMALFPMTPSFAAPSQPPTPQKCSSTKSSNVRRSKRLPRTPTRLHKSSTTQYDYSCRQASSC